MLVDRNRFNEQFMEIQYKYSTNMITMYYTVENNCSYFFNTVHMFTYIFDSDAIFSDVILSLYTTTVDVIKM